MTCIPLLEGKILLFGLTPEISLHLAELLSQCRRIVVRKDDATALDLPGLLLELNPDVVFCRARPVQYGRMLEEIRCLGRSIPVIVVSQTPDVPEWLDAMDAGVWDYCSAPFELSHIQWIIENTLTSRRVVRGDRAKSVSV